MEVTLASLCEPRLELGESRKICPLLVPSILKHICILRSVLPTLAFQKEYLVLSGVSYVLSQNLAWLPRRVGRQEEQTAAALGLDAFLSLRCSTGRLGSNPGGMPLRGSSGAHLPPQSLVLHWFWNVSAVQRCTFPHGAKSASSVRQFPCAPVQTVSFGLDHNPLLPRALLPLC